MQGGPIDVGHQIRLIEADRDHQVILRFRSRNEPNTRSVPSMLLRRVTPDVRHRPSAMPSAAGACRQTLRARDCARRIVPSRSASESTLLARKRDPVWRTWLQVLRQPAEVQPGDKCARVGRIWSGQRKGEGQEMIIEPGRRSA